MTLFNGQDRAKDEAPFQTFEKSIWILEALIFDKS